MVRYVFIQVNQFFVATDVWLYRACRGRRHQALHIDSQRLIV